MNENKNVVGYSPCYNCGREFDEADDWSFFGQDEDKQILICPDCLEKTNMVWKFNEAYTDVQSQIEIMNKELENLRKVEKCLLDLQKLLNEPKG